MTDPKRATGRTLGLALQAIGKAVENPGTEVEFINHNPQNYAQHRMCKQQIELLAETLYVDVSVERTLAEEKWKELYGGYPSPHNEYWRRFERAFKLGFEAAQK